MTIRIKNRIKLTFPLSYFPTCPPAHYLTFPPADLLPARPCNGFTLIELVAVLAVMSFCAFMSAGIFIDKTDQECLNRTVFNMEEIKKALLGVHSKNVPLKQGFGGFISHMGGLPPLNGDAQPEGLWKWEQPADDNGWKGEFKIKNYDMSENGCPEGTGNFNENQCDKNWTYMGWRGPYIVPPDDGILRDGWGNPFRFEVLNGRLRIISPGSDGMENESDKGYDKDIIMVIRKSRYMCSVAGYVDVSEYSHGLGESPGSKGMLKVEDLRVVMHYPVINDQGHVVDHREFLDGDDIEEDGYFRIEDVPVGFRFIMAWEEKFDDPTGFIWPHPLGLGTYVERREEGDHAFNYGGMGVAEPIIFEKVKNLRYFSEPGENWIGLISLQIDTGGRFGSMGCPYPKD